MGLFGRQCLESRKGLVDQGVLQGVLLPSYQQPL